MTEIAPRIRRARRLRQDSTLPEQRLWQAVRGGALGVKLRRQHPIGRYVADFAYIERKLVIEMDGPVHEERAAEDAYRSAALELHGRMVLRVPNRRIMEELPTILDESRATLGRPMRVD